VERSAEARKVLQELDAELASASTYADKSLVWMAADREVLRLIAANIDRDPIWRRSSPSLRTPRPG
jgi:hypothetical protein